MMTQALSQKVKTANKRLADKRVAWRPQPKQVQFLQRPEYEGLYGGAAGGGKSDSLLSEGIRQAHIPHYRGIIFRKTYPELSELMDRSTEIYKPAFPRAKFNESKHFWTFPSGAKLFFGAMQHTKDRKKYQGKRYDFVGFDEATHFSWDEYSYMYSRNRPSGKGTRVYRRAATNPGGIGHGWCKSHFGIGSVPPITPMWQEVKVTDPCGKPIKLKRSRIFVPATVFDNKKLLEYDPNYLANLALMPKAEQEALLYGSWDSFDGQVFTEWTDDPAHYHDRVWTHVIKPFRVPSHWARYRAMDWGYAKPFSVGWYAADTHGKIYKIAEYYGCEGTPDKGIRKHPVEVAAKIREIEEADPNLSGKDIFGVADPAIYQEDGGESIAALMAKSPNFVYWNKADNTRLAGKMQMHYRLAFDEEGDSMFQVFDTCRHTVRTLPILVYSDTRPEDVNTNMEDHAYDETRYMLMESPIAPRKHFKNRTPISDPLDLYSGKNDLYKFFRI